MAATLSEKNGGKVLEVRVSGKLSRKDYQRFAPAFERLLERHGKIRVLFEMTDFHGWGAGALWDDIRFDLKHFSDIERLAMVGDKRWQKGMSQFCRPFTTARIRYFDRAAIATARAWIEEAPAPGKPARPEILRVFQTKGQTRAFYDKISRVYDLLSDRSEAPMRKAGLHLLKAAPGEKILEIGCGTGHCLAALAEAVGPAGIVFGLDLSEQMLAQARNTLAQADRLERCQLRCGDAAQLPYGTGRLDAVFMSFTLELFDTPQIPRVLGECQRVLRAAGRLVVVGMSKKGPVDPMVGVFEWAHRHFPQFLDCRPIYVQRALEQAGFQIEKTLTKHMWVPVEIVRAIKSDDMGSGAAPDGVHGHSRPS